jgi:glycosyltransferase involved in cell wall biosynthesis
MKLLMISMDRKIFDPNSAVAKRQIEYAKKYEEVHIIIFTKKGFKESTLGSNIFVYPTNSISRWLYVFDALKLGRFIVEKRNIGDVSCDNPFETGLVGALIKNRHPVSLELQIHTDIGSPYFQNFNTLNKLRTKISKYTLLRADHIRVVSYRIQEYLSIIVEPSRIEVRPIVVDTEKIKNAQITVDLHKKYPQFSKIVLMSSRLEPEKNIGMALEAFKKVVEQVPQAGLVILGTGGEEAALKKLSQDLGIQNSVIFEGWQMEIATYLKTSDCFLNTSWYEGYGMTLVEAKSAGTKIVSTNVGIAREIDAEIVEWNPESIARGIITAIN